MKPEVFIKRTRIEASAEQLFRWHARPGALMRLTPPWESVEEELVEGVGIEVGARVALRVRIGPFYRQWISEHRVCDEGQFFFRDEQVKGPFVRWDHLHRFEPADPGGCYLKDHIEYVLPLGLLGKLFGGRFVRRKLERMFDYRHRVTAQDMAAHRACGGGKPLNILVTGSSGLIGSALVPFLTTGGHRVVRLVRMQRPSRERTIAWNPSARMVNTAELEGLDAVVHLAGEGIATGRWTPEKKAKIRDS